MLISSTGHWNWSSLVRGYFSGSDYSPDTISKIIETAEKQSCGVWHAASTVLKTPCGCADCKSLVCPVA